MSIKFVMDKDLIKKCWLFCACTFPFFAVSFGRINIGLMHIAMPMLVIGVIAAIGISSYLINPYIKFKWISGAYKPTYTKLAILCCLFLFLHGVSLLQSMDFDAAFNEIVKLSMAIMCFWTCVVFFPRDKLFIEKFIRIVIYCSAILMAFLIYKYLIVFQASFLGTNLEEVNRYGKGQLTMYLATIVPYAFFFFMYNKMKLISSLCLVLLIIALLYGASRSSWLAVAVGLIYVLVFLFWADRRQGVKITVQTLSVIAIFGGISSWAISQYVDIMELSTRFLSIYDPNSIPEDLAYLGKHSYEVRGDTLLQAWNGFLSSPLIGVGLTNTINYVERLTHNDYMTVLLELGVIGLTIFVAIILFIWRPLGRRAAKNISGFSWVSLGARASLISLLVQSAFINTYSSVHFWVSLAMYVVILDSEDRLYRAILVPVRVVLCADGSVQS